MATKIMKGLGKKETSVEIAERLLQTVEKAIESLKLLYQAPQNEPFKSNKELQDIVLGYLTYFRKALRTPFTADRMKERLAEFRERLKLSYENIDEGHKEHPLLGLREINNGVKAIMSTYDGLEKFIKDREIAKVDKEKIIKKVEELREKYRTISKAQGNRNDPITILYEDWEDIFRALLHLMNYLNHRDSDGRSSTAHPCGAKCKTKEDPCERDTTNKRYCYQHKNQEST